MEYKPSFSPLPPPRVFRQVAETRPVKEVRARMAEFIEDGFIYQQPNHYKLDTAYNREMRVVSQLGQACIDQVTGALELLAPESWHESIVVPVAGISCGPLEAGSRRIVIDLDETEELREERQRTLAIVAKITKAQLPLFDFGRKITLGKIAPRTSKQAIETQLHGISPQEITLLPTRIQ